MDGSLGRAVRAAHLYAIVASGGVHTSDVKYTRLLETARGSKCQHCQGISISASPQTSFEAFQCWQQRKSTEGGTASPRSKRAVDIMSGEFRGSKAGGTSNLFAPLCCQKSSAALFGRLLGLPYTCSSLQSSEWTNFRWQ